MARKALAFSDRVEVVCEHVRLLRESIRGLPSGDSVSWSQLDGILCLIYEDLTHALLDEPIKNEHLLVTASKYDILEIP